MPYISINEQPLHYLDLGEGDALLFGHSYLWDHRMWREQIRVLSRQYRCIVPDLWGHGLSGTTERTGIRQLADDHLVLMQSLGIDKFSVIGLSVGGMWGTQLALSHPEAVQRLVIMDSFVGSEPEQTKALYFGMLDLVEKSNAIPEPLIAQLLPIFLSPDTLQNSASLATEFKESLTHFPQKNIPTIVAVGRSIFSRGNLLDDLPKLQMPVMIAVGEHDRPRPVSEATLMAKLLPQARLEIIPKAGHISCLEQPEAANKILTDFLENSLP